MTTKQLFLLLNQIYLNKPLFNSLIENHPILILSEDNYYDVISYNQSGSQIEFIISVEPTIIKPPEYKLNWRFTNSENKIVTRGETSQNQNIPHLIENLITQIIRDTKIDHLINQ